VSFEIDPEDDFRFADPTEVVAGLTLVVDVDIDEDDDQRVEDEKLD
jgi:hypothetical protein